MPSTPAASTADLMSSIAKGFTIAVISFIEKSALGRLGGFRRAARGGKRAAVGLVDAAAEDGLVRVGLFLVHSDITELQHLVRCAQLHEEAEDSQDGEGDEGVPDDDGERGAQLDQDLYGVMAPQPARGGD